MGLVIWFIQLKVICQPFVGLGCFCICVQDLGREDSKINQTLSNDEESILTSFVFTSNITKEAKSYGNVEGSHQLNISHKPFKWEKSYLYPPRDNKLIYLGFVFGSSWMWYTSWYAFGMSWRGSKRNNKMLVVMIKGKSFNQKSSFVDYSDV